MHINYCFSLRLLSFPYSVEDHELLEITPQGAKAEASLNRAKKGNDKSSNLTGTKERIGRCGTVIDYSEEPFGAFIIHNISWQS